MWISVSRGIFRCQKSPFKGIPSVYQHILLLMRKFGIELIDTRFSYSVRNAEQSH